MGKEKETNDLLEIFGEFMREEFRKRIKIKISGKIASSCMTRRCDHSDDYHAGFGDCFRLI